MRKVTQEPTANNGAYSTDSEIAELLGITLGRLHNKLCAGNPLPPRIQPPGCRHRLWPRQAVHEWLEQFTILAVEPARSDKSPRRHGRPTKEAARARQ
jgi:hypothetical protein